MRSRIPGKGRGLHCCRGAESRAADSSRLRGSSVHASLLYSIHHAADDRPLFGAEIFRYLGIFVFITGKSGLNLQYCPERLPKQSERPPSALHVVRAPLTCPASLNRLQPMLRGINIAPHHARQTISLRRVGLDAEAIWQPGNEKAAPSSACRCCDMAETAPDVHHSSFGALMTLTWATRATCVARQLLHILRGRRVPRTPLFAQSLHSEIFNASPQRGISSL